MAVPAQLSKVVVAVPAQVSKVVVAVPAQVSKVVVVVPAQVSKVVVGLLLTPTHFLLKSSSYFLSHPQGKV